MIDLIVNDENLLILPNEEEIKAQIELYDSERYQDWFPDWTFKQIEYEILEPYLGNGWSIIEPELIGALTEGLLLSNGELLWWDTDYMIVDWLDVVLNQHRGYKFKFSGSLNNKFWDEYYGL